MKLAITFGSFNPPTMADRALLDALAGYHGHDTECIALTDTRFDDQHPMGVLEKHEALHAIASKNVQIRMDYEFILKFIADRGGEYDQIVYLVPSNFDMKPAKLKKLLGGQTTTPVIIERVDVGDTDTQKFEMLAGLHGQDYELFCNNYGGSTHDVIRIFNNLKERVIWKNAKTN